jgi:hypothetical protein
MCSFNFCKKKEWQLSAQMIALPYCLALSFLFGESMLSLTRSLSYTPRNVHLIEARLYVHKQAFSPIL